jgi:hypothetical protein
MDNWMKMGLAGIALAGGLSASAQETPSQTSKAQDTSIQKNEGDFHIEASDLIAKKLRDYVKDEHALRIV